MSASAYSYPTNRRINQKVILDYAQNQQYNSPDDLAGLDYPRNGPELADSMVGGSKYRKKRSNYVSFKPDDENEYVQPGSMPIAPYLNAVENARMNKMSEPYEYLQGTGMKKPRKLTGKMTGGDYGSFKGEKNDTYGYTKGEANEQKVPAPAPPPKKSRSKKKGIPGKALTVGLDVLPGLLSTGTAIGLSGTPLAPIAPLAAPVLGYALSQGREAIREKTGYGKSGGKSRVSRKKPVQPLQQAQPMKGRGNQTSDRRARRNELVREVMAKQKCSLPQASSYIKQHGLV